MRATPFARLKALVERALGRVVLVHLSVIGGMALLAWWGEPRAFFGIFVVLKLLADIGGVLPQIRPTSERRAGSPGRSRVSASRASSRVEYWRESHARDRKEAEEDEQVWDEAGGAGARPERSPRDSPEGPLRRSASRTRCESGSGGPARSVHRRVTGAVARARAPARSPAASYREAEREETIRCPDHRRPGWPLDLALEFEEARRVKLGVHRNIAALSGIERTLSS
jgi:hypothetical protein